VADGLVGTLPSLTDLDKGEPKMTTDFRGVYNAVPTDWMGLQPEETKETITRWYGSAVGIWRTGRSRWETKRRRLARGGRERRSSGHRQG